VAWKGDPIDPELRKKVNRLLLEERKAPTKDNVCSKNYDPKDVAYNVPFWETVSAAEFSAINEGNIISFSELIGSRLMVWRLG